jgi:uncharacterized protein
MSEYIMSASISLFAGIIGGVLGIGGGIITVPALLVFMGYGQHLAQGNNHGSNDSPDWTPCCVCLL